MHKLSCTRGRGQAWRVKYDDVSDYLLELLLPITPRSTA